MRGVSAVSELFYVEMFIVHSISRIRLLNKFGFLSRNFDTEAGKTSQFAIDDNCPTLTSAHRGTSKTNYDNSETILCHLNH